MQPDGSVTGVVIYKGKHAHNVLYYPYYSLIFHYIYLDLFSYLP